MEKLAPLPRSDSMRNHGPGVLMCFFVGVLVPKGGMLLIVSFFWFRESEELPRVVFLTFRETLESFDHQPGSLCLFHMCRA